MDGHEQAKESGADSGIAALTRGVKKFVEGVASGGAPDPTDPVINPTTTPSKPLLSRLIADIVSQVPRFGEDAGLVTSLVDTTLFDGGIVDDRQYQVSLAALL